MANGREPDCIICKHFDTEPKPEAGKPVIVSAPSTKCFCRLHRLKLPYQQTEQLLICRDWEDYKSAIPPLVDWPVQGNYLPGLLYGYDSIYSPSVVVAEFSSLPAIDKEISEIS